MDTTVFKGRGVPLPEWESEYDFLKILCMAAMKLYIIWTFDPGGSSALYDLIREDGSPVDFSLYDWKSKKL